MQDTISVTSGNGGNLNRKPASRNTGGLKTGALSLGISAFAHLVLILAAFVIAFLYARNDTPAQPVPNFTVKCIGDSQELSFEKMVYNTEPITVMPDNDIVDMPRLDPEEILSVPLHEKNRPEYRFENQVCRPNTARLPFQIVVRDNAKGAAKEPVGNITTARIAADNPKPSYPYYARTIGYEGLVVVRVEVTADGTAGMIELAESSGYSILDEAAMDTVKQWAFVPAMKDGLAITTWLEIPIRFVLTD